MRTAYVREKEKEGERSEAGREGSRKAESLYLGQTITNVHKNCKANSKNGSQN